MLGWAGLYPKWGGWGLEGFSISYRYSSDSGFRNNCRIYSWKVTRQAAGISLHNNGCVSIKGHLRHNRVAADFTCLYDALGRGIWKTTILHLFQATNEISQRGVNSNFSPTRSRRRKRQSRPFLHLNISQFNSFYRQFSFILPFGRHRQTTHAFREGDRSPPLLVRSIEANTR